MHYFGKVACFGFLAQLAVQFSLTRIATTFLDPAEILGLGSSTNSLNALFTFFASLCLSLILAKGSCSPDLFEIVWKAQLLGGFFGHGLTVISAEPSLFTNFAWYTCIMSIFHFSEFVVTSLIRPQNLSTDSFLLNHSKAYGIAAATSWIEYLLEAWLFPSLKGPGWICSLGIITCIVGEVTRKLAMLTAGSNFDHLIRVRKEEKHQLVTSGVYRLCRHPSYVGWFYWSVGTQLVLCNPFCTLAYAAASWRFFYERIYEEEITLLYFFGEDYKRYQSEVPTGLPFIHGYQDFPSQPK